MLFRSSLRERIDDIPLLVDYFARKNAQSHARPVPAIDEEVYQLLSGYGWPGNVRELENVLERAIIISQDGRIGVEHLPHYIVDGSAHGPAQSAQPVAESGTHNLEGLEKAEVRKALREADGNVTLAARMLGISRNTLYRKMKQYSL